MSLKNIRNCEAVTVGDKVILTGIDKTTNKKITISLNKDGFDEWINGFPLRYACPDLSAEERRFLLTGAT